ncbi:MAG: ligase-associated DNA damage response endonuclease PdeM [Verrucomicrobiaceae bacterium]|nr:MAG: ligase-associated DNA damage response endonuclease PdeM [Verrucomicrobiaceae bacterium]
MNPFTEHPHVTILPEGVVLVASTLVVADVHLGKSATFRAKGLPVPEGDTERDFRRLAEMVVKHGVRHLVIAGDLFHAPAGMTGELETALAEFLTEVGIPVTLVMGNHDAKLSRLPVGLVCVEHLDLDQIRIIHDPASAESGRLHISGHWHPVVRIPDGMRTSLRLPCFLYRGNTLVLPAFGSFTGGAILAAEEGDRIFAALRDQIVEIPRELL